MSFAFGHQKAVQGGGVPLPDGTVTLPASAPCGGTGQPLSTYPFTLSVTSNNALFYDYNINGGAFTASTPVPGNPPVTGNFVWSLTIPLPTNSSSMQQSTSVSVVLRLRPIADVGAVTFSIPFTAVLDRCARPVGLTINGCSYNGCDTDRCTISWSSTAANVASSMVFGVSVPSTGSAIVANDPGAKAYNFQSISGVAADAQTGSVNVTRFYQTECGDTSACQRADCRGAPTGCGGNWVTDCRGICVDPGSAWGFCDCPSPGSCVAPGTCQSRDCAGTCGGSFVTCDCPSPGSCVASCQQRDCAGVCGGSAMQDCFGVCNGTAMDCGCGCGNTTCMTCPNGSIACNGNPCPAAPPSCSQGARSYFECCGCTHGPMSACSMFAFEASCSGDPSQNCMISVNGGPGVPGSSFSTTGGCISLWDMCANCDGGNPGGSQNITITCNNGSATVDNNC